ncbi:Bug family tripartite tricarboxylate transporter substrate binding protein [Ottowia thiooxydans]|uniref:Bug family tripartite tricarboxylate transporter substrate binding protein n=1 Tax=Ottowia thiooxydans TaxID=219182 RepID=UPI0003F8342A|nr:tripartite tricarboxylate transporter substrate-binding protein [Ottowia thiooxydans]
MSMSRRRFAGVLGASALGCATPHSFAQDKTLRILVGYTPGGAMDTVARAVGDGLRNSGYSAIIDNKAGASGRLAMEALLAAPADGTTLLMSPMGNLTLYPHVFKNLRYNPLKQFAGVNTACTMGFALAVGANSPAKTLEQFLEMARRDNGLAAYGTPGAGTAMHFIGQLLAKASQVPLTHVAYKGGSVAVTDAIGGSLPAVITTLPNLLPMHRTGKLRILAISNEAPLAALPGVPTFKSAGFPDLVVTETFAFFAHTGTPAPVIAQLNQSITQAVKSSKINALLEKQEYLPRTSTADALDKQLHEEYARWGNVVKTAGYTPED